VPVLLLIQLTTSTRGCHLGTCCRLSCDRGQTVSQRLSPQNCAEAGQRSRRFEGTKSTIETMYLKSSLRTLKEVKVAQQDV